MGAEVAGASHDKASGGTSPAHLLPTSTDFSAKGSCESVTKPHPAAFFLATPVIQYKTTRKHSKINLVLSKKEC